MNKIEILDVSMLQKYIKTQWRSNLFSSDIESMIYLYHLIHQIFVLHTLTAAT